MTPRAVCAGRPNPLVELLPNEPFGPAVEQPLVVALQRRAPVRIEDRQIPEVLSCGQRVPLTCFFSSTEIVARDFTDSVLQLVPWNRSPDRQRGVIRSWNGSSHTRI